MKIKIEREREREKTNFHLFYVYLCLFNIWRNILRIGPHLWIPNSNDTWFCQVAFYWKLFRNFFRIVVGCVVAVKPLALFYLTNRKQIPRHWVFLFFLHAGTLHGFCFDASAIFFRRLLRHCHRRCRHHHQLVFYLSVCCGCFSVCVFWFAWACLLFLLLYLYFVGGALKESNCYAKINNANNNTTNNNSMTTQQLHFPPNFPSKKMHNYIICLKSVSKIGSE